MEVIFMICQDNGYILSFLRHQQIDAKCIYYCDRALEPIALKIMDFYTLQSPKPLPAMYVDEHNLIKILKYNHQCGSEEKGLVLLKDDKAMETQLMALGDGTNEYQSVKIENDTAVYLACQKDSLPHIKYIMPLKFLENKKNGGIFDSTERYLNAILDYSSDFFYAKDKNYRFGPVNMNFAHLTGYHHWVELRDKTDYEIFPKEMADNYRKDDQSVIEKGQTIYGRIESYPKNDGTIGWVKTSKQPIRDEEGNIVGLFGFSTDITSIIEAEELIKTQKQEFETIFYTSKDSIAIVDVEAKLLFFNDALTKLTGYTYHELIGKTLYELQIVEEKSSIREIIQTLLEGESIKNMERFIHIKDGTKVYLSLSLALLPDRKRILISARDITDEKERERLLDAYIRIIDHHVITSEADLEGNILKVSDAFCEVSGYQREELIGMSHRFLEHPDMSTLDYKVILSALDREDQWTGKIKKIRKDGSVYWVETIISPNFNIDGKQIGFTSISQNISDRMRLEQKTEEQNSLLTLFNYGDSVLFRWHNSKNWPIDYVSSNVDNLLGYTQDEFMTSKVTFENCVYPDDLKAVLMEVHQKQKSTEHFFKQGPYRVKTKFGEIKWVYAYVVIQRNVINEITHFLGYIVDISEREHTIKNLERFIDTQDNIVILTNGKMISFANKKFFEFLKYQDLARFKDKYQCICDLFIKNNQFFHMGKLEAGANWIEKIKELPEDERIVSLEGPLKKPHVFSVKISDFNEALSIVSFTDISKTIFDKLSLEERATRDNLTHALNRAYFERNYMRILNEMTQFPYELGMAFLDIDHFKGVNDKFGHHIGDEVLMKFVRTIEDHSRTEDYLIRWGGEEFVLLIKVKSNENLMFVLEKLRSEIELSDYGRVGKITCSIGGTIYSRGELIETTIERADRAMYMAKAQGRNQVITL